MFRWGILATGSIAHSFARALNVVEDAELLAVGSRSMESAETFANQHNIPRRYASYEALVADPDIDIIYIATPHPFHYDNMKLCLNAGKHVLCEKPLTVSGWESAECIALAHSKKLFLMEAVWMRFFPAMDKIRELLPQIGDIRLIQADFSFYRPFDPAHRLYNRELGGGALIDLGIYPLSLTIMLLGFPKEVTGWADIGATGVDEINALTLTYDNAVAHLTSSMRFDKPIAAFIVGTNGTITIPHRFLHPDHLILHIHGRDPETIHTPYIDNGYAHEIIEVRDCLRAGKLESDRLPLEETRRLIELMETLRIKWGVLYPSEIF